MKHRQKWGLALLLTVTAALCLLCGSAWTDGVASGTCGTNLTWTLDAQGALTVSGTGKIIKTSPHHGARAMSEIFFVKSRRENAGILVGFQVFATKSWRKIAVQRRRLIVR